MSSPADPTPDQSRPEYQNEGIRTLLAMFDQGDPIEVTRGPLIEAGKIKPVVYKTFPLEQASEAHRLMESSQHIGKLVLSV